MDKVCEGEQPTLRDRVAKALAAFRGRLAR
jgi:hypothetical protein